MTNTIKVITLTNNELTTKEIPNTLEALQHIVGGYIEIPYLSKTFFENDIDMIINDEGKFIEGLKPEIAVVDNKDGKILDIVYGNCIFASHDEEGNTTSINADQTEIIFKELKMIAGIKMKDSAENILVRALFI